MCWRDHISRLPFSSKVTFVHLANYAELSVTLRWLADSCSFMFCERRLKGVDGSAQAKDMAQKKQQSLVDMDEKYKQKCSAVRLPLTLSCPRPMSGWSPLRLFGRCTHFSRGTHCATSSRAPGLLVGAASRNFSSVVARIAAVALIVRPAQ